MKNKPATPTPGSPKALRAGCTCPILDNHRGRGLGKHRGKTVFVTTIDCPLHGERTESDHDFSD